MLYDFGNDDYWKLKRALPPPDRFPPDKSVDDYTDHAEILSQEKREEMDEVGIII